MKGQLLTISLSLLLLPNRYFRGEDLALSGKTADTHYSVSTTADALYNELNLSSLGLSPQAFNYAYKGYQYLSKKGRINTQVLVICDMSQSSNKKRFYVLDLSENKVLMTSYVAHGKGSGMEYASRFSNKANSHQSSLGFYVTGSTYYGEHGLSLRLLGLESGFNDHAVRRNIVIHGAPYIGDRYLQDNRVMGRSYGCPAVPDTESDEIINLIKDGTCLFIYHPTKTYLKKSRILNG